jgi:hypothetical protein
MGLAALDNFVLSPGPVIDAREILERAEITLYCLEDGRREAVFIEAPPGLDLSQFPFYNLAQYKHAIRVLTVPYDTLHQLAASMGDCFKKLILLHSVGRCGGTLVSRALGRLDNVISLDEPDPYVDLTALRPADGSRDEELTKLLHSCTRLMFKAAKPGTDTMLIKFRSICIEIGDLFHKAFPDARVMFMYRNADTWSQSAGRSIQQIIETFPDSDQALNDPMLSLMRLMDISKSSPRAGASSTPSHKVGHRGTERYPKFLERAIPLLQPFLKRTIRSQLEGRDLLKLLVLRAAQSIPGLRNFCATPQHFLEPYVRAIPPMQALAFLWLSPMHRYLAFHERGFNMLAMRYETLTDAPLDSLRAIFEHCDLPLDKISESLKAFSEDSQQNTPLSRDRVRAKSNTVDPELLAQLRKILREHPVINKPDFVLPNTFVPKSKQVSSNN